MDFDRIFTDNRLYSYYKSRYEDISEPLKEYQVHRDGSLSLMREPRLLGVKRMVNGDGLIHLNDL